MRPDASSLCTYANPELGVFFASSPGAGRQLPNLAWNKARTIGCFISGDAFIASSDVQVQLIHLYEQLGLSAFERLNGWFSGLLVDLQHRQAILFNDRYGLGRIYIHEGDCCVLFSTEAKSLLAAVPESR